MFCLYKLQAAPWIYHPVVMFLFNLISLVLTFWYFFKLTACTSGSASVLQAGDKAELKSPGYPYDVPEHLSCRWLLEAPTGQVTSTFNLMHFTNLQPWCSIPVRPNFPVHIRGKYKWSTHSCTSLGSTIHHVACTTQSLRHIWMAASIFALIHVDSGVLWKPECYTGSIASAQ